MDVQPVIRWRVAAVAAAVATVTMLVGGVTAAGAQEEPPVEEPTTTVPGPTVPGSTSTTIAGPGSGPTSTAIDPPGTPEMATSTTASSEPESSATTVPDASTTTLAPRPPDAWAPDERPTCQRTGWWPYMFVVEGPINEGDVFDDPDSDLVVAFTAIDWVVDHLRVTIEANYLDAITLASAERWTTSMSAYPAGKFTTVTLDLPVGLGDTIGFAEFCYRDPAKVNAEPNVPPPVSPTTATSVVVGEPGGGDVPVTVSVAHPPVPTTDADGGGTLPKTGSDALPLALAGAGLVAVGGGLLLGRRVRRAEA